MKTKISFKGLAVIILLVVVSAGCKKEEVPPEFDKLSFDTQDVLDRIPSGLTASSDEYAQECVSMIEDALDFSDFIDQMEVPSNAQKTARKGTEGTWKWTWSYMGEESWTFYWTYEEDNSKRYWTMEIQYGAGPRVDYIEAWETLDGTQGEVVYNFNWAAIYYGEQDYYDLDLMITWQLDSSDAYHYSWYWSVFGEDYDYLWQYDIVVNADGSGSIDFYYAGQHYYYMEWDAAGNGSWHYYIIGTSGTWTAG